MATNEFGELSQKKYYATERLTEIKQELLRLATESNELKAALNTGAEEKGPEAKKAIALARRRRSYLAARSAKLKEERDVLKVDLETLKAELSALDIERRKAKVEAK
jgi:chromosome segregation ATPase